MEAECNLKSSSKVSFITKKSARTLETAFITKQVSKTNSIIVNVEAFEEFELTNIT